MKDSDWTKNCLDYKIKEMMNYMSHKNAEELRLDKKMGQYCLDFSNLQEKYIKLLDKEKSL